MPRRKRRSRRSAANISTEPEELKMPEAAVSVSEIIRFLFPSNEWFPHSTARLSLLAEYGPLKGGVLCGGPQGKHKVSQMELRMMISQNEPPADDPDGPLPNYSKKQVIALLSSLPSAVFSRAGRLVAVSFHELQAAAIADRERIDLARRSPLRQLPTAEPVL
ncbi:uncharacterized protein AMSG_03665 [Thecamonas trahens ATCC 50062]|uniref:Uncharacterized protein n=1 Tax=Thecamonas trahens ATCC 50062 TaxID=461836 RepID=A0A0L0D590_THETB|nr:hypothetical protein AMSG_03665 [Thecamonas trahens ATCC 50062]KNC47236.1 hypothetical protein AMSG_03665 [Thecamonas trahens ATCC 50062]|eukprot:XP_013759579.1 hypothetical protein AMSG_03665 [Thecamonas trahens ATCC 50062]